MAVAPVVKFYPADRKVLKDFLADSEDRDTVARGVFAPDCAPHDTSRYLLSLPAKPSSSRINLLCVEICDVQDHIILRQSIPVNPKPLSSRLLENLPKATEDVMEKVQGGMLIREGRKASPAPDGSIRTEATGPATHIMFSLTPDTTDTSLSELGIASPRREVAETRT